MPCVPNLFKAPLIPEGLHMSSHRFFWGATMAIKVIVALFLRPHQNIDRAKASAFSHSLYLPMVTK